MTPERQQMIEDTWCALEPTALRFVEGAVQRLLEIAPESRSMFDSDGITNSYAAIAGLLGQLVGALDEPKRFVPLAVRIGRDNADRGVDARLYSSAGDALIWALHQHLGVSFTPEIQTAWVEGHHLAAAIMQRAAQSHTGEFERFRTDEFRAYQIGR
jgi:hemoglobin-like flavoprotein